MKHMPLWCVMVAALTVSCDIEFMVLVTAPLTRPLPTVCIKSVLDTIGGLRQTSVAVDSAPPKGARGTIFRPDAGVPLTVLEQYHYRDGTAALQTWVSRCPGPRYSKTVTDSLGKGMGATLLRVRDACGGSGIEGSAPNQVKRHP